MASWRGGTPCHSIRLGVPICCDNAQSFTQFLCTCAVRAGRHLPKAARVLRHKQSIHPRRFFPLDLPLKKEEGSTFSVSSPLPPALCDAPALNWPLSKEAIGCDRQGNRQDPHFQNYS